MRSAHILIPRGLLKVWLAFGAEAPLEPGIRRFMEARFGAELGDVRIHTGAVAARLCDTLQARALTLGSDILFADGEYAPYTADGLQLLAHELVHVLQQRAAIGPARAWLAPPGFVSVGDERDACEHEADRLAAEALDGGLRSGVTPDRSGAIRRAIQVLDATASMTASYNGATPGIAYVQRGATDYTRMAVLHLTRNSRPIVSGAVRSAANASAMRITGTVMVKADPKDTIADIKSAWSFHFVQLFYVMLERASYAGRTKSDGSMLLDFAGPANYVGYGKFLIDSDPDDPAKIPYADTYTGLARVDPYSGMWRATVLIDDHPFVDRPLVLPNFAAANKDNYLYAVARQFYILTTMVAVDLKTGTIRPLVHADWGALCVARLRWSVNPTGGREVAPAQLTSSYFSWGGSRAGAPANRTAPEMVKSPDPDPDKMYNRASRNAMVAVIMTTANSLDVDASAVWSASVPPDHFK